ncbi:V/A-type H+-transporting ATPase subunit D [Peptoniphilus ivorii]|uniref:V-type ATP synthase subunit D n=1 Tax=Aedoeadaptatus ivorii TaxID=54006 RepID=UPI00278B0E24|nr:V-type ATP synthase subunit D [Peptoniphilus ivorii]MDQ0508524.1 V/A-type H+-transporting ATPase subunit D [Peptoniphilus ivorii]
MANKVTATKANLMKIKSALSFAKKGYGLLDKKRAVLMREMMRLNDRAATIQQEIEEKFAHSYESLTMASVTMGWEAVVDMSKSMPKEEPYKIGYRSVMGVEIPEIHYKEFQPTSTFSIFESSFAFDQAYIEMHEMRARIYELAELETDLYRLAKEIKKTVKRANALEKIQIPKYEQAKKEIEEILAEKEREDFFRLKRVKSNVSE